MAESDDPAPARVEPKAWVWWFGLVFCSAVGLSLTALAYADGLPWFIQTTPQLDKVFHFLIAGFVVFFLDGVLKRRALRVGPIALPLSAVLLLAPAAVEEYLQRHTTYRTSSIWDFAADVAGVVVFTWLSRRAAP